jgi:hypothetical protein
MRQALKDLESDDFDSDHFVDTLSDSKFEFTKEGDLKHIAKEK